MKKKITHPCLQIYCRVFAKNLLNLPLDYLEIIKVFFYNQALHFCLSLILKYCLYYYWIIFN